MNTEEIRDIIIQKAKDARYFLERDEKQSDKSGGGFVYVISAKWLREWKQYTSYDRVIQGEPPDEDCSGRYLPRKINQDIVLQKDSILKYPDEDDYRNVVLKEDIRQKVDYEVITEDAWKFFASRYEHIAIKRPVHMLSNGEKEAEVMLKQVWIVPMNNNSFRHIDHKRMKEFKVYLIQTSSHITIQDFKADLVPVLTAPGNEYLLPISNYGYHSAHPDPVIEEDLNIWLLNPALDLKSFFREIQTACMKSTSYDYKIGFKGQNLEKEHSQLLNELSAPEDILFIDVRASSKRWAFVGDALKQCGFCRQFKVLNFECICKEVAYCSEDCKEKGKRYHLDKCKIHQMQEDEKKKARL